MVARIRLPNGCKGIDFPIGVGLNANRHGVVEVPDALAKMVKRSTDGVELNAVMAAGHGLSGGKFCSGCAFRAWPWTTECPRCGGTEFEDEDAASADQDILPDDPTVTVQEETS